MDKLYGKSLDLEKLNIEKLKELFPQVVTEGKIDFDKLRLILGDEVEEEIEKYQFTWNGKSRSIKLAQTPSTGTLIPVKDESKNWDNTENLYIEGDNLEVLKLLQKTYYGKIKMIYIDPPYNTGGDFVYKDDFKDNIKNYKEQTNQTTRANPETSGRFHTDWLNMMYSRLLVAKNLLEDDGVMYVSIDENEFYNLIKICNEIFGEDNIDTLIWRKNGKQGNTKKINRFKNTHEYIIAVYKNKMQTRIGKVKLLPNWKTNKSNPDNDPRGNWESGVISREEDKSNPNSPNYYSITLPSGRIITREFYFDKDKFNEFVEQNKIYFPKNGDGIPRLKIFESEEQYYFFDSIIDEMGTFTDARNDLIELFGGVDIFDTPKPEKVIRELIRATSQSDSYILDFFSGSATTAHAVMQLNAEDGGDRKFIMVQLPELTDESSEAYKAGYKNICEIGKERIRRAGEKIKQELIDKQSKAGMLDENIIDPEKFDNGFKVFKLDSTNIIPWDGTVRLDENTLFSHLEVIKEDRSKLDVLYEIMLKYGAFDKPVEEVIINGKTMFSIAMGYLIVCLEDNITMSDVLEIGKHNPKNVIFKESGFSNDNDKINATYTLEKLGVEEIKSI
ncbi:MAG: site-specific DNA-methyltransferase [Bacilli bacterium]